MFVPRSKQYILGALDSHYKLRLFIKQCGKIDAPEHGKDWRMCVDVTESYRNLLISQFWSINIQDEEGFNEFEEYKKRMYEVAVVDFIWVPEWNENRGLSRESSLQSTLITAHASGDICIWKVCVTSLQPTDRDGNTGSTEPQFYLSLEFRRNLIPKEITSNLAVFQLSESTGLLVVGTTRGTVKAFRVEYNTAVTSALKPMPEDDEQQLQKYVIAENGVNLCEGDMMGLLDICCVSRPRAKGSHITHVYVFKKPNFLLQYEVHVPLTTGVNIGRVFPPKRIVKGDLTGIVLIPHSAKAEKQFLLAVTQAGMLSCLRVENGRTEEISFCDLSSIDETVGVAKDPSSAGNILKRIRFGGLAISPNGVMLCTSNTLAEYYNHLALRTPSILQFHSLFPSRDVWQFIHKKCDQNDYLLHQMTDIFAAYRVLMTLSEQHLKDVLDWAVPLSSKSIQDLRVLFWILRMQPDIDKDELTLSFNLRKKEPQPFLQLKVQQDLLTRRGILISDRIMQLHCLKMVKDVVENPEKFQLEGNAVNLQSLMVMYDYLETKAKLLKDKGPLPMKPRVLLDPPPRKPVCCLCFKPTKLVTADHWNARDLTTAHKIDNEQIEGVLWSEQQHAQKSRSHPIGICVLSLLPISFPHRTCSTCGVACMLTPAFGQKPYCSFCNGFMECQAGCFFDEPLEGETDPLADLVRLSEEQQVEAGSQEAPISRRARIENMYIDM